MTSEQRDKPSPQPGGESRARRWFGHLSPWWLVAAIALLWGWQETFEEFTVKKIPYSEFKQRLSDGEVESVVIEPELIEGRVAAEGAEPFAFRTVRVEDEALVGQLEAAEVDFAGQRTRVLTQFLLGWGLPLGLMFLLWSFMGRRMSAAAGQALSFGKSNMKLIAASSTGVTFDDVAGCDEAKFELQEVVEFLRHPKRYEALGAKIPRGVLLLGPPGTGKTLLARAVAGEAGVTFYSLSGSDFVEMFAGVGAARVRDLFEKATAEAPCIIFIDEIDAIGRQRGVHMGVVNDEREQTLNQLLVEMDGFDTSRGVILLAATNRPDILDRALLRPGRFDRQVVLDAPDMSGRLAILKVHTRDKPLADEVDLEAIARATPGFSGADLANAVNEGALLAARGQRQTITQADLEAAVERVVAGPERKSRRMRAEDKRRVAYHEAGHALVAHYSPGADPVHKISVVPRGSAALGYTMQLPQGDRFLVTERELRDHLGSMLGGRAAEVLVFAEATSGAENDLEKATSLARRMIAVLGMSERIGLARCEHSEDPRGGLGVGLGFGQRDCSEQTAREIDEEVKRLLDDAFAAATATLTEHRAELDRVAAALIKHETLDAAAFRDLLQEPAGGSHGALRT